MTTRSTTRQAALGGIASNGKQSKTRQAPPGVEAPNYDRPLQLEILDFDDPDRPKSCLEVDFPIGPINTLAQLEINAKKPIYEMGKWWARRQSSIFRSMLIAAATQAPDDENVADQRVWEAYYANHQKAGNFTGLRVLDPFMGGGTTLIEGARLGFDVWGNDLNPVAWLVTKTALSDVDPRQLEDLFRDVEYRVRPQLTPFSITSCPRGHRGRWYRADDPRCPFDVTDAINQGYSLVAQPDTFDILAVAVDQRVHYRYAGPEVIYTFWAKHGPCSRCGHRTPVMRSPIVAVKSLTVRAVTATCRACNTDFDWELDEARMAPAESLVVAPDEAPHVVTPEDHFVSSCPCCGAEVQRPSTGKPKRKKVSLTLLLHPEWLSGSPGADSLSELGGWAGAPADLERRWIDERSKGLRLIEVRGSLPRVISDPLDSQSTIDTQRGTLQRVVRMRDGVATEQEVDSSFACGACGYGQDFLTAVKPTGKTAPTYPYVLQGYCPECDREKRPYNGRFFKAPDQQDRDRWISAIEAWEMRRTGPLGDLVPDEALPFAHMTHDLNGGIPNWGYTHWWKMFNPRQLLTHTLLLDAILAYSHDLALREVALITFQQYLRNQNMFCFWDLGYDKLVPFFSNNNYHPKATVVENTCFADLGRGNWFSCSSGVLTGLKWARSPWEKVKAPPDAKAKALQLPIDDPVLPSNVLGLTCGSSTDLSFLEDQSFDLVITDPPFGGNVFYADLADFFYVWLREPLAEHHPDYFRATDTNKVQEAITNPAERPDWRTPEEKRAAKKVGGESPADEFYRETLTACWRECARVMKDGGTLAFTFHHDEDQAWIGVLRSLFDAGFVLVATYPIRSDESKGEDAAFGSRKIEYDIIHVCRKRLEPPQRVSWASMRRWVKDELQRLHSLLQHYQARQLSEADIRVILRGKALEYYSRHYGEILTGLDEPLDITQALIGINEILEEERMPAVDRPPDSVEPLTGLYLRIFTNQLQIPRDDLSKLLRGTATTVKQFLDLGWAEEENRQIRVVSIQTRFNKLKRRRRDEMKTDLDQAHFLIGAAVPNSGTAISDELNRETFLLKPSVRDILAWYAERETDTTLRDSAGRALTLVEAALRNRRAKDKQGQMSLFDLKPDEQQP